MNWFDKPFDRLTVLSKVEGQITMTEFEIPNDWFLILFEIWILYFGACILVFGIIFGGRANPEI